MKIKKCCHFRGKIQLHSYSLVLTQHVHSELRLLGRDQIRVVGGASNPGPEVFPTQFLQLDLTLDLVPLLDAFRRAGQLGPRPTVTVNSPPAKFGAGRS